LLYGSSDQDDIVFYEELKQLEASARARISIVHVLSCEEVTLEGCEQGFITAETIKKYADLERSTFFVCGPHAMYEFVAHELERLQLPRRRIRKELSGPIKEVSQAPGFPTERAGQNYQLRVHIGNATENLPARADETVLVAMERAKLVPPSRCRSGECGLCRSLLLSGDVYIYPDGDGRRAADRQSGYIHPCSSYPVSDLELAVPGGG
jgi:ferredoxin